MTKFSARILVFLSGLWSTAAVSAHDYDVVAMEKTEWTAEADLLTAGLGLDGLKAEAPTFSNPAQPTAGELRRLAIHYAWNALAYLHPAGGLGEGALIEDLPLIPGQEVSALLRLRHASHPFRALVQIPESLARAPASHSMSCRHCVPNTTAVLNGPMPRPATSSIRTTAARSI